MRFYGCSVDGMYVNRHHFLFSLLPMIGLERDDEIWALHFSWLNVAVTVFTGVDNGED